MTQSILIVEDEQMMQRLLSLHLEKEHYEVHLANHGQEALDLLSKELIDLAIVDVMMPVMDGFSFIKELRKTSNMPVIFLTAKADEENRIQGLKLGGDDYLSKPFSKGELLARVEAVLRRTTPNPKDTSPTLMNGPLTVQMKSRHVLIEGASLSLTVKEFDLLHFLLTHIGQAFSREHLLCSVWGIDYDGTERTVDTHIKTIRMKLKPHEAMIETVWGIGYKMVDVQ